MYWGLTILLIVAAVYLIGIKMGKGGVAAVVSVVILVVASLAYYFHFQQVFVKQWGGVMSISVPNGQHHIGATWKDQNLWIESYDPVNNTCIFSEYSKGNLLEGTVKIKNCNPLMPR